MSFVKKKITDLVDAVLPNSIFLNAYVELENGKVKNKNWGDDINVHFLSDISSAKVALYYDNYFAMKLDLKNYLCIGSVLNYLTTPNSIVWGAGVIDPEMELRARPKSVCAVRGPLTRKYLREHGVDCPEVFGDPALLIPFYYRPEKPHNSLQTRRQVGIIPHYSDFGDPIFEEARQESSAFKLISVSGYAHWKDVIDQICRCDVVLSSSLHGVILAEAYGVPSVWISVSNKVIGNGFKFRDFYASIGKNITEPAKVKSFSDIRNLSESPEWSAGAIDLRLLLENCPFAISDPSYHEHPLDLP